MLLDSGNMTVSGMEGSKRPGTSQEWREMLCGRPMSKRHELRHQDGGRDICPGDIPFEREISIQ